MKLVADQNISAVLVRALREAGYEVDYIEETAKGSADPDVLAQATAAGALLLTDDSDFGELVFHRGHRASGVLYLRLEGMSRQGRIERILGVLRERGDHLLGAYTVVTPDNIRSRPLQGPA